MSLRDEPSQKSTFSIRLFNIQVFVLVVEPGTDRGRKGFAGPLAFERLRVAEACIFR